MIAAFATAALGLTQVYVCNAKYEGAAFLTQDLTVMNAKDGEKSASSSFKISVSEMEVRITKVDDLPVSRELVPFSRFGSNSEFQYYSPNTSFFRRGMTGPEVLSFVRSENGDAKLMSASPIAMTIGGGQYASGGKDVPAIQLVKASCLLEKEKQ